MPPDYLDFHPDLDSIEQSDLQATKWEQLLVLATVTLSAPMMSSTSMGSLIAR